MVNKQGFHPGFLQVFDLEHNSSTFMRTERKKALTSCPKPFIILLNAKENLCTIAIFGK